MPSAHYDEVISGLRVAYDGAVEERSSKSVPDWKRREWDTFAGRLQAEGRKSILEIGSGTGVHARYFTELGFDVTCTDLSAAMVAHCRSQGLEAFEADVVRLDLGRTFDAAFAFNSLLHVPPEDLPSALDSVVRHLEPSGLFYLGQYGGINQSGAFGDDTYVPKRYFSWLEDVAGHRRGALHRRVVRVGRHRRGRRDAFSVASHPRAALTIQQRPAVEIQPEQLVLAQLS
ncbi:MAG TPA: class I SAM-dependent methyltransferase [Acidimicrobiales bacterium]|nr:class I SAM-dependent methyltransferase [Acidimicrobiales bacterium]